MKLTYTISKEEEGMLLRTILKEKLFLSRILMIKMKETKQIYCNDIPVYVTTKVKEGDIITAILPSEEPHFSQKFKLVTAPLDILYEDECFLAVNKPANMPVHPSCDHYDNTLSNIVASHLLKQGVKGMHIITRLDKNTTGVCLFAKHAYFQELMIRKEKQVNLQKEYIAIITGILDTKQGDIILPIARKEGTIMLREVNTLGDYAHTAYTVLQENSKYNHTVIQIELHTGRTHQIRVHFSYLGHPLLGDDLYAPDTLKEEIMNLIPRQALHCHKLSFYHPVTKEKIVLTAPLPDDMKVLIKNNENDEK